MGYVSSNKTYYFTNQIPDPGCRWDGHRLGQSDIQQGQISGYDAFTDADPAGREYEQNPDGTG